MKIKMESNEETIKPHWKGFGKKERIFWIAMYGFIIAIILLLAAWFLGIVGFALAG